jgi:hypothetical protein
LFNELFSAFDIGCAANTAAPSRREPNLVTDFVNALLSSVNPAETKRFIDRFWPSGTRLARILFEKPNPKLSRRRVIFLEPVSKISGCSEELDVD